MYYLAGAYYNGKGLEQSYQKAVEWYTKASDLGDGKSQYYLAFCYYEGKGVQKSKTKALELFRKSCKNFYDEACNTLNRIK